MEKRAPEGANIWVRLQPVRCSGAGATRGQGAKIGLDCAKGHDNTGEGSSMGSIVLVLTDPGMTNLHHASVYVPHSLPARALHHALVAARHFCDRPRAPQPLDQVIL